MKKIIYTTLIILSIGISYVFANEIKEIKPFVINAKKQEEFDKVLNNRLQLTQEQWDYIHTERQKDREKIEEIIKLMQQNHDKIQSIYKNENSYVKVL